MTTNILTPEPVIIVERAICEDTVSPLFGQEDGYTRFSAGDGDTATWVYFHDDPRQPLDAYLGERVILPLKDLPAIFENLKALMGDPRFAELLDKHMSA